MSIHKIASERSRWVVRWREDGRNRAAYFDTKEEAVAFDAGNKSDPELVARKYQRILQRRFPDQPVTVTIGMARAQ